MELLLVVMGEGALSGTQAAFHIRQEGSLVGSLEAYQFVFLIGYASRHCEAFLRSVQTNPRPRGVVDYGFHMGEVGVAGPLLGSYTLVSCHIGKVVVGTHIRLHIRPVVEL